MFPYIIDRDIELRLFSEHHADKMFDLIYRSRDHLGQWLRWVGRIQSANDAEAHIWRYANKAQSNDGFHAAIWYNKTLAGGVYCPYVDLESRKTEIGFWLGQEYSKEELAVRILNQVLRFLFLEMRIHRVEMQVPLLNEFKRTIAVSLNFELEGVKRESEWLNDEFIDVALFSLLDHEWQENRSSG